MAAISSLTGATVPSVRAVCLRRARGTPVRHESAGRPALLAVLSKEGRGFSGARRFPGIRNADPSSGIGGAQAGGCTDGRGATATAPGAAEGTIQGGSLFGETDASRERAGLAGDAHLRPSDRQARR